MKKKLKKNSFISNSDPYGSYTGIDSVDPNEVPTQDADDL